MASANIWRAISEDGAALIEDDTLEGIEQLFRRWLKMSDRERATMAARAFPCYASRFTLNQGAQTIKQLFLEPNTVPPGVSEVARTA